VCVCVWIKIYRTIILAVVFYGCETWSLTLREERCRCGQSGTGTGSSLRVFRSFPVIIVALVLHIHSSIIRWMDNCKMDSIPTRRFNPTHPDRHSYAKISHPMHQPKKTSYVKLTKLQPCRSTFSTSLEKISLCESNSNPCIELIYHR